MSSNLSIIVLARPDYLLHSKNGWVSHLQLTIQNTQVLGCNKICMEWIFCPPRNVEIWRWWLISTEQSKAVQWSAVECLPCCNYNIDPARSLPARIKFLKLGKCYSGTIVTWELSLSRPIYGGAGGEEGRGGGQCAGQASDTAAWSNGPGAL